MPAEEFAIFQQSAVDVLGGVIQVALVTLVIVVVLTTITLFAYELLGW